MANHKSAIKRIRANDKKRLLNRYQAKTTRNAMKNLQNTKEKGKASEMLVNVASMLDKLAKKNIIHKNKAANLKSALTLHVNSL
jgi:small subunit ribosomal protein S20